jgi:hypothetical protein
MREEVVPRFMTLHDGRLATWVSWDERHNNFVR